MPELTSASNGGPPLESLRVAIELAIPSDVRYIERVVDLVKRQCVELQFAPQACSLNVPVALAEALSNAILYGNEERPGSNVTIRAQVDRSALVVEIADEGHGFSLDECMADPTAPENLEKEDGRGLFLMTRLMDRVERFGNGGNVVRLTLRRR
jgi:serine/threonine-protein kinase RsbW